MIEVVSIHGNLMVEVVSIHGNLSSIMGVVSIHGDRRSIVGVVSIHGNLRSITEVGSNHGNLRVRQGITGICIIMESGKVDVIILFPRRRTRRSTQAVAHSLQLCSTSW